MGPNEIGTYYSSLHRYCLGDCFNASLVFSGPQGIEPLWKSGILQAAEEVVRARFFMSFVHQVVRAPFHLFHPL